MMLATLRRAIRELERLAERSIQADMCSNQASLESHILALESGRDKIAVVSEKERTIRNLLQREGTFAWP